MAHAKRLVPGLSPLFGLLLACAPDEGGVLAHDIAAQELSDEEVAEEVEELGLDEHECGDAMKTFAPVEGVPAIPVFKGKDLPWHKWRPCLDSLSSELLESPSAELQDMIYTQILYLLSHQRVRFYKVGKDGRKKLADVIDADGLVDIGAFERLVETNDNGIAYSSMDQVDMGLGLLRLHEAFAAVAESDDPRTGHLLALGLAAFGVVADPVGKDGLRSKKTCEDDETLECSWFHAETSTNSKDSRAGGTLNKHLYAVRELYRAADILEPLGIAEGTKYRRLATEGLNQLVYAGSGNDEGEAPNLKDFIPRHDDEPIPNSWLYYGRNNMTGKEYFLDNRPWKNCNYHVLVLRLLHNTLPRAIAAGASIDGFTKHRGAYGMSLLAFVVQSYQLKDAEMLYVDSATENGGFFGKCHDGKTKELEDIVIQELLAM